MRDPAREAFMDTPVKIVEMALMSWYYKRSEYCRGVLLRIVGEMYKSSRRTIKSYQT
jgi:hypothetical protein